jgi:hypothetical protein
MKVTKETGKEGVEMNKKNSKSEFYGIFTSLVAIVVTVSALAASIEVLTEGIVG